MSAFHVPLGRTRRIGAQPVDDAGNPQGITGNVSYSSDNPAVTVTPNAGVGGEVQVDCHGAAVGTANITASAQDAENPPVTFSSVFQIIVDPNPVPHATHFVFTDMGLL